MFINRYGPMGGWGGSVILGPHNLSIIPPVEHNFEHNTLVSRATPESIILYFFSIIRQTLRSNYMKPLYDAYTTYLLSNSYWPLTIKPEDHNSFVILRAHFVWRKSSSRRLNLQSSMMWYFYVCLLFAGFIQRTGRELIEIYDRIIGLGSPYLASIFPR